MLQLDTDSDVQKFQLCVIRSCADFLAAVVRSCDVDVTRPEVRLLVSRLHRCGQPTWNPASPASPVTEGEASSTSSPNPNLIRPPQIRGHCRSASPSSLRLPFRPPSDLERPRPKDLLFIFPISLLLLFPHRRTTSARHGGPARVVILHRAEGSVQHRWRYQRSSSHS